MSALFVVLPLAVFISALAVGAFLWAARHGQLDDLETPALRLLHDEGRLQGETPRTESDEESAPGKRLAGEERRQRS